MPVIGFRSKRKGVSVGKSALFNIETLWGVKVFGRVAKSMIPRFQEKLLLLIYIIPVPRTNTGSQGEYPKVCEITIAKELGKLTPYVRKKGCPY